MKIVLTGGGTAGHIMPNIALLPNLKKHFEQIYYIGGKNGVEKDILKQYPEIEFTEIECVKLVRKFTFKNLLLPLKLVKSIWQARKELKRIKPNVVFSKGGFVSVPVVIASRLLKIPVISHESDLSMGLANKIILLFCKVMCTSFLATCRKKKCIHTGSPIRAGIFSGKSYNVKNLATFDKTKKNILIFGGSMGAVAINNIVKNNLEELCLKYNIVHIVGKNNTFETKYSNYYQTEFVHNIADFYEFAELVVCRAGANAIFELCALKKPMLLIPLPKDQSRGDQIENAKVFKNLGYAELLLQENMNNYNFFKSIEIALQKCYKMKQNMSNNKSLNSNQIITNIILNNVK